MHRVLRLAAVSVLLSALPFVTTRVSTQTTPDPDDVAEGMRLFRTKGDCQSCHGWAADGRKMDTQMPDGAMAVCGNQSRECGPGA